MNKATEKKDKKDLFYIVVLILTFVAVIVGATFAIYSFLHKQKEGSSAVYTGTLSIEYLAGDIIKCNSLYPIINPTYTEENNVYKNNFKVTNSGSLDSLLTIKTIINQNEFSDKTLSYKIFTSDGEELENGTISGTGEKTLAENVTLPNNTTDEFTLMIWLKETGENQNVEMRKSLMGTIQVDANQKID